MPLRRLAPVLLAATAVAWSCTGGQSGTETPTPMAGQGGIAATGGGNAMVAAGAGTMMAPVPAADAGRGGSDDRAGGGRDGSGDKAGGRGGDRSDPAAAPSAGFDAEAVCACALAGRGALLRGELLALDPCQVRARVVEVLDAPPGLALALEAGDQLEARRAKGSCSAAPSVALGDEVLLVYAPDGAGGGDALIATWSDPMVFGTSALGAPIALARDAQSALLEQAGCTAAFDAGAKAAPALEPCTDAATFR